MNILESIILLSNDAPFYALGRHWDTNTGEYIGNEAAFIACLKIIVFYQNGMTIFNIHQLDKISGVDNFSAALNCEKFLSFGDDGSWKFTEEFQDLSHKITAHFKNFESNQTA